jgi:hypothetical protein
MPKQQGKMPVAGLRVFKCRLAEINRRKRAENTYKIKKNVKYYGKRALTHFCGTDIITWRVAIRSIYHTQS